jgi:RNA polymerase sigma factor (sigma-70 family)
MVNANYNRFRKRRVTEQLTDAPPDLGGVDLTGRHDDRTALVAALQGLPRGQRAVIVLRYWMDMPETEAAETLGCSVGNVKSQASRALAKLRVALAAAPGAETTGAEMTRGSKP